MHCADPVTAMQLDLREDTADTFSAYWESPTLDGALIRFAYQEIILGRDQEAGEDAINELLFKFRTAPQEAIEGLEKGLFEELTALDLLLVRYYRCPNSICADSHTLYRISLLYSIASTHTMIWQHPTSPMMNLQSTVNGLTE